MYQYLAFVDAHHISGAMEIPLGFDERLDALYLAVKQTNERGKEASPQTLAAMLALHKGLTNRG